MVMLSNSQYEPQGLVFVTCPQGHVGLLGNMVQITGAIAFINSQDVT